MIYARSLCKLCSQKHNLTRPQPVWFDKTNKSGHEYGMKNKPITDDNVSNILRVLFARFMYGRPSPPKIQGCQIDQQIHRWLKDQLQDSIANKGMAWPNYRQSSFP